MRTTKELAEIELIILDAFRMLVVGDVGEIEALVTGPPFLGPIAVPELRARYFQADNRADGATACLHGDCQGKLTNCHLIHLAALSHIAEAGHLLEFEFPNDPDSRENIRPVSVGLRKFSGFPGFCNKHDSALFRRIDTLPPEIEPDDRQILAWHTRSVAATLVRNQRNLARMMNFASLALAHTRDADLRRHTLATAWRTMRGDVALRQELREALSGDVEQYQLRSCMTPIRIPFAGAGFCTIDVDVNGNAVTAENRVRPPALTLAIVPGKAATRVYFACTNRDWLHLEADWSRVESDLSAGRSKDLLAYAVRSALRIGMSPSWWSSLAEEERSATIAEINQAVARTMTGMLA